MWLLMGGGGVGGKWVDVVINGWRWVGKGKSGWRWEKVGGDG